MTLLDQQAAREAFYAALVDDDPETLYDRAPCGYLSTSPDGTIVKVNATFLTWTGYAREDLVLARSFASLLSVGGRIYYDTHVAPMLQLQGSVREISAEVVRADGRRIPVLLNAALDSDEAGSPRVVRIVAFDATERREYERELLRAKERAESSEARARALARTLQRTLIPPSPPDIPGLDVAAVYRPAGDGEEVGGDFYDVFEVAEDDWVVVLGDVCGKGVEAAVLTALVRHSVRAVAVGEPRPAEGLQALNAVLLAHHAERFCTIVLMRVRRAGERWVATLSLGGHARPLLMRGDGEAQSIGTPGTLVGILEAAQFHDTSVELSPGTTVVLFTDGVTEGRRGTELYGEARLLAAAQRNEGSCGSVVRGILDDVLAYQDGVPRDDIAVVAIAVPSPS